MNDFVELVQNNFIKVIDLNCDSTNKISNFPKSFNKKKYEILFVE
jgi:hypothetical protein